MSAAQGWPVGRRPAGKERRGGMIGEFSENSMNRLPAPSEPALSLFQSPRCVKEERRYNGGVDGWIAFW